MSPLQQIIMKSITQQVVLNEVKIYIQKSGGNLGFSYVVLKVLYQHSGVKKF